MTPSPTPTLDGEAGEASYDFPIFNEWWDAHGKHSAVRELFTVTRVKELMLLAWEVARERTAGVKAGPSPAIKEEVGRIEFLLAQGRMSGTLAFTKMRELLNRTAIPALPPDTGKQALTDEQIDQVLGAAYRKLVLDTGYTGGMGSETWDRAAARAIEAEVLAASQPAIDTGKQAENVYDLIPPSAAEWFANSPGIANHDWRGGWDACRNRARTLVEEYRAASKADERMRHDYPILQQFHTRHALGAMAAPSCLCCGHQTHPITRAIAVQHMELPAMVVCQQCKAAASQPAPTPDAAPLSIEDAVALVRAKANAGYGYGPKGSRDEFDRCYSLSPLQLATVINAARAASMQDTSSPQSPQGGACLSEWYAANPAPSMSQCATQADYWKAMYEHREREAHELSEEIIRLKAAPSAISPPTPSPHVTKGGNDAS